MKTLIVGAGEIGSNLSSILSKRYETKIIDKDNELDFEPEIMHICFPYSEEFIEAVKDYQKNYKPKYTIIHSTVPVGTSKLCDAVHSPCMGIHPDLKESMLTFTKYLGGEDSSEVAQYFRRAGMKVYLTDKSETTELMKILSTSFYGLLIEWTKEVKDQCDEYDVPFEMWTHWTNNYNTGYEKLGHPEFHRPNLVPIKTKIKGHCILPNLEFLESKFTKFIGELNDILPTP